MFSVPLVRLSSGRIPCHCVVRSWKTDWCFFVFSTDVNYRNFNEVTILESVRSSHVNWLSVAFYNSDVPMTAFVLLIWYAMPLTRLQMAPVHGTQYIAIQRTWIYLTHELTTSSKQLSCTWCTNSAVPVLHFRYPAELGIHFMSWEI